MRTGATLKHDMVIIQQESFLGNRTDEIIISLKDLKELVKKIENNEKFLIGEKEE